MKQLILLMALAAPLSSEQLFSPTDEVGGVELPEQPAGCNGDIDRSDERIWEWSPSKIHDTAICLADRAYIIERILDNLQYSYSGEDYLCDRLDDAIYQAQMIREDMNMEVLRFLGD